MKAQLVAYWHWWVGQMSDALPTLSTARKRAVIVATFENDVLLLRGREAPYADIGALDFTLPNRDRQSARAKIMSLLGRNRQVVLSLPEDSGVRRLLELPQAAEAHLDAIASNELDRLTPWRPDQAVFTARVAAQSSKADHIDVEVTAVPRFAFTKAEKYLQELDLSLIGLLLARPQDPPQFIQLDSPVTPSSRTGRRRRRSALAAALLLSALLAAAFGQKYWEIRDLRDRMVGLKGSASHVQQMLADLQKLSHRAYFAVDAKRKSPSAIVTLEALGRILPDDCWLDLVTITGDKVTIQGHASDALALLPLLISSEFFQDAQFDSEVTRDVEAGIEGFSITAKIVPHAAP